MLCRSGRKERNVQVYKQVKITVGVLQKRLVIKFVWINRNCHQLEQSQKIGCLGKEFFMDQSEL
jgi:hypothetical protein